MNVAKFAAASVVPARRRRGASRQARLLDGLTPLARGSLLPGYAATFSSRWITRRLAGIGSSEKRDQERPDNSPT